jgi:hypothetical protein
MTTITGAGIAQLYLDNVYWWFGLPTKAISDRDPWFTSHFRWALAQHLRIQQNLSSAFYPQTNGLSEWMNQWIEQYLRLVTSASPKDWTYWLTIASAVYNNRVNQTIGTSPNQILLGYNLVLMPLEGTASNNQIVNDQIRIMIKKCAATIDVINHT